MTHRLNVSISAPFQLVSRPSEFDRLRGGSSGLL